MARRLWKVEGASNSGRVYVFETRAEAEALASANKFRGAYLISPEGVPLAAKVPPKRSSPKVATVKARTSAADRHLEMAQDELGVLLTSELRENHPKTYALVTQEYDAIEKVRRLIRSMP